MKKTKEKEEVKPYFMLAFKEENGKTNIAYDIPNPEKANVLEIVKGLNLISFKLLGGDIKEKAE